MSTTININIIISTYTTLKTFQFDPVYYFKKKLNCGVLHWCHQRMIVLKMRVAYSFAWWLVADVDLF
jgi:hypothetical protein